MEENPLSSSAEPTLSCGVLGFRVSTSSAEHDDASNDLRCSELQLPANCNNIIGYQLQHFTTTPHRNVHKKIQVSTIISVDIFYILLLPTVDF